MSVLPLVVSEYQDIYNGGHVQNATLVNGPTTFPGSGVFSDGTTNLIKAADQNWQPHSLAHETHEIRAARAARRADPGLLPALKRLRRFSTLLTCRTSTVSLKCG